MSDLLKVLPIILVSLVAQIWFSYFNFTFWLSRLKSENYVVNILNLFHWKFESWRFESWWTFTIVIWFFNAMFCYIPATVLIGLSYRMSLKSSGMLSSAMIIIHIVSVFTSVFFMYLRAGELPNRNGWIALILIILASLFAANPGRNA